MGLRIFLHSVGLVLNQLNGALRISGVLYLVSIVLGIIGFIYFMPVAIPGQQPTFSWQLVPISVATGLCYLWIAVSWHRYVLLDELPNRPLPAFHGDRMLAYFGRIMQFALLGILGAIVFTLINLVVIFISRGAPAMATVGIVVVFAFIVFGLVVSYRLAPIFPGAAVGRPVGLGQAWAATRGANGAIIVLAIVSAIASIIIDLPVILLAFLPAGPVLVFIWASLTGWIKLMVGVSILTTLFGVYVEKRAIAE